MGLGYQVLPKTKDVPHKVMNTSSVKMMLKQQSIYFFVLLLNPNVLETTKSQQCLFTS